MSYTDPIDPGTPVLAPAFAVGGGVFFGPNENLPDDTGDVVTIELAVYVPAADGIAILPIIMEPELAEYLGITNPDTLTEEAA